MSSETVPRFALSVLELFSRELAGIRFADLDANELGALVRGVETRTAAVEIARTALDRARSELDDARALLMRRSAQAVAHARILAVSDSMLRNKLDVLERAHLHSEAALVRYLTKRARPPVRANVTGRRAMLRRRRRGALLEIRIRGDLRDRIDLFWNA